MPTIAHRSHRLPLQTSRKLTIWLLSALVVAAVAIALALLLGGSDGQSAAPQADTPQAAPQAPTPFGGTRP